MDIYIGRNGKQRGPFSLGQVKRFLAQGKVKPTDNAWHEGLEDWVPVEEIAGHSASVPKGTQAIHRQSFQTRQRMAQHLQRPRRNIIPVVSVVFGLGALGVAIFVISQKNESMVEVKPEADIGESVSSTDVDAIRQMKRSIAKLEEKFDSSSEPPEQNTDPVVSTPYGDESQEGQQVRDESIRKPPPGRQLVCGFCRGEARMTGAQILDSLKGRIREAIEDQLKFDLAGAKSFLTKPEMSGELSKSIADGQTEFTWNNLFFRTRATGVSVPDRNTSYACPVCDPESEAREFIKMMKAAAARY